MGDGETPVTLEEGREVVKVTEMIWEELNTEPGEA